MQLCERPHVLLHIGLPKTGTTSLQTQLFDRHPGIRHFGQPNVWSCSETMIVLRALLLDEPSNAKMAREHISYALDRGARVVISDEALTFGEFMMRARRWPIESTPEIVAARARRILGKARILLVLRNQSDWLVSWHREGLKKGKYTDSNFERWLERDLGNLRRDRLFELLDYNRLVAAYIDQFGADHVDVRFYEDFRDEFARLASVIARTLDLDETGAHSLIADSPAANVTQPVFRHLPPSLSRISKTGFVRAVLDRAPSRCRATLRELFVRNRAYESVNESTGREVRLHFKASNGELMDRLSLNYLPAGYS